MHSLKKAKTKKSLKCSHGLKEFMAGSGGFQRKAKKCQCTEKNTSLEELLKGTSNKKCWDIEVPIRCGILKMETLETMV